MEKCDGSRNNSVSFHQARGAGTTVNSEVTYECLAGAVPSVVNIKVTCEGSSGLLSRVRAQWSLVVSHQQ